jgi:pimeloyl-ACP methyl ester carboxylesterase
MTLLALKGPQGKLMVEDEGAGEPAVLFLHCDCGSRTQWSEALAHLRSRHRAVAFDLRGLGLSGPATNADYSYAGRAEDVAAVIRALDLAGCVLVGHSGGGIVALHYAAAHPATVSALLLVDPATDGRQFPAERRRRLLDQLRGPRFREVLLEYYGSIAGSLPHVRQRVLRDAAAAPQEVVVASFEALGAYDPRPALRGYRGRRLSLVTPVTDTPAGLHQLSSDLPFRRLNTAGHWPQLDDPAEFHRMIDAFLRGDSLER